jgi:hypothetical protein
MQDTTRRVGGSVQFERRKADPSLAKKNSEARIQKPEFRSQNAGARFARTIRIVDRSLTVTVLLELQYEHHGCLPLLLLAASFGSGPGNAFVWQLTSAGDVVMRGSRCCGSI